MTAVFDPKEMLRKKVLLQVEKQIESKFCERGRDYLVDELTLGNLYDVKIGKKIYTYVYSYEDKIEVKKAFPRIFCFTQEGSSYKITKKV